MTGAAGPRGLVVAAPRSGAGKTTIALGLMRALRRRGLAVQPFKCGPDYIDPAFHAVAAGRPSYNLDTWAMAAGTLSELVARHGADADIALVEGVMGLFDGVAQPGQTARGATADLAALFGWPVVLVLDVGGQTETAAAVAMGCARYRDDVRIAGVILNRVSSPRHLALVAPAFDRIGIRVFGAIANDAALTLPERHLGLVQAGETADIERRLDTVADAVEGTVDLDAVRGAAEPTPHGPPSRRWGAGIGGALVGRMRGGSRSPGRRLAVGGERLRVGLGGGRPARRSFPFHHLPTSRPIGPPTRCGCPAAIPNFMPVCFRLPRNFRAACGPWPAGRYRSMASAAGTWCWGGVSRTRAVFTTRWRACSSWRRRLRRAVFISAIAARDCWPTVRSGRSARRSWDTNFTMPARWWQPTIPSSHAAMLRGA